MGRAEEGTRVKVTEGKEAAILAMFRESRKFPAIARTVELTRKTVWPVLEAAGVNKVRLSRATARPPLGSEPVGSPSGTVRGVQLRLDGPDGNAFDLPGTFQAAARHQGWTAEAIRAVFTG